MVRLRDAVCKEWRCLGEAREEFEWSCISGEDEVGDV